MRLRALVDMGLRKSPDLASPLYGEWWDWPANTVFEPPPHLDVARALARGIVRLVTEETKDGGKAIRVKS